MTAHGYESLSVKQVYQQAGMVNSVYYINILMTTIFRRFPITFRRFPKIFQNCCEGQANFSEHFRDIFQR